MSLAEIPSSVVTGSQVAAPSGSDRAQSQAAIYARFEQGATEFGCEMPGEVLREAGALMFQGADVSLVEANDPAPDPIRRKLAGALINGLTFINGHTRKVRNTDPDAQGSEVDETDSDNPMYRFSGLRTWRELGLGTGLGIYTLYGAKKAKTLGEGIEPGVFDEPLFGGDNGDRLSATQVLARSKGIEEAERVADRHRDFINARIDPVSRVIFSGSEDAVGIRVRSVLAASMALEAVKGRDPSVPLRLGSIGCGSAIPVARTVDVLGAHGFSVESIDLLDMDPMALATAMSILRQRGVPPEIIRLHHEEIKFRGDPVPSVQENSLDIVDAWGFLEYFKGRSAAGVARTASHMLAPGGKFVFGNMLTERAQREYFDEVVDWKPKVIKRTLEEARSVLTAAGYEEPKVVLPSRNTVYAGYMGTKPSVLDGAEAKAA